MTSGSVPRAPNNPTLRRPVVDQPLFLDARHQCKGHWLASSKVPDVVAVEDDVCEGAGLRVVDVPLEQVREDVAVVH